MRTTAHKAVAALIGGALTGLGTAMADGQLSWPELVAAAGLGLAAAGAVWRVPNRQKLPKSWPAGLADFANFETPRDS
jgi:hypothetical protein